jgi:beta-galactosidase
LPDIVNMTGRFPLPAPVALPGWGNNVTPAGSKLSVDTIGYAIDGVPWLQVMGEFQFSRTPAAEWADNLARMKASGVTVVGSYVFWLHHQEQQGWLVLNVI